MSVTIEELRAEHGREVIGPNLRSLLARIVAATAPIYPADEYSDAWVWNEEALEDALHDWIAMRLLRRGDLAAMLLSASSLGSFRGALTKSFSQFLRNRRRRTSASNLYTRMQKVLRTDSRFQMVGHSSRAHEQLWTLRELPVHQPTRKGMGELVAGVSRLTDDRLRSSAAHRFPCSLLRFCRAPRVHSACR
jgi:transposase